MNRVTQKRIAEADRACAAGEIVLLNAQAASKPATIRERMERAAIFAVFGFFGNVLLEGVSRLWWHGTFDLPKIGFMTGGYALLGFVIADVRRGWLGRLMCDFSNCIGIGSAK